MDGMESAVSTTATPESVSVETSTSTEVSSDTSTPSAESASTTSDSKGDIRVVVDESGNRRIEMSENPFNTEERQEAVHEPPQEEAPNEEPSQVEQPSEPQYYADMNEVVAAAASGILDETRLSSEQRSTILALQQQQAQKLAMEQRRAQEQAQAEQARQQAFGNIAVQARQQALQVLGITEADLTNATYVESGENLKDKFEETYNNLVRQGQYNYIQNEVVQAQRQEAYNRSLQEINNFCNAERVKEPHYDEIVKAMDTAKYEMPYREAQSIVEAEQNIQNGILGAKELETFRKYYDYCKRQAYQKASGVSTTPRKTNAVPKVEQPGQPHGSSERQSIDIKAVRGMNAAQRSDYMRQVIASMM